MSYIDADYDVPSVRFQTYRQPLPLLLDAVAATIGMRVVVRRDGTVRIENYTDAKTVQDANVALVTNKSRPLISGGAFNSGDVRKSVPSSVTVAFARTDDGMRQDSPYTINVTLTSLSLTEYTGVTGYSGSKNIIGDPIATQVSGGTPTNLTLLTAWATQAATDFYKWSLLDGDYHCASLVDWTLNGQLEMVEWHFSADRCSTRASRDALNDWTIGNYFRVSAEETGLIDISGRTGSVADVTAVQFLRTVVSGTSNATVVEPDNASASLPGDVSLSDQTMGDGDKTFQDDVIVNNQGNASETALQVKAIDGSSAFNVSVDSDGASTLALGSITIPSDKLFPSLPIGNPTITISGGNNWVNSDPRLYVVVSSVNHATPIEVTTGSAHGIADGETVTVEGVVGEDGADGVWEANVTGASTLELVGSVGTGSGAAGGGTLTRYGNAQTISVGGGPDPNLRSIYIVFDAWRRKILFITESGQPVGLTFTIQDSDGLLADGATGTGGGGDGFDGGICTSLGTASANIQTLLDTISTTQGVLIYYNGTDWVSLGVGSAGGILQSGGAAANPSWTNTLDFGTW